jgi:hypothetical protein
MTSAQNWFIDRRSTYTIDTPCLTKHFLITATEIKPTENFPERTNRVDSELDKYRRQLIMLDSLRLADAIANKFCPENEERFLHRREGVSVRLHIK